MEKRQYGESSHRGVQNVIYQPQSAIRIVYPITMLWDKKYFPKVPHTLHREAKKWITFFIDDTATPKYFILEGRRVTIRIMVIHEINKTFTNSMLKNALEEYKKGNIGLNIC